MRHLMIEQAIAALRRGKQVEQYLGQVRISQTVSRVRWLTAYPSDGQFVIAAHHVESLGPVGFGDLSEMSPVDPEEYVGEGVVVVRVNDPSEALARAGEFGAVAEQWVNSGLAGAEFLEDLARNEE